MVVGEIERQFGAVIEIFEERLECDAILAALIRFPPGLFREIAGKRVGARFDLKEIRSGRAADPQIVGGDTIVVGYSSTKGAFRDFVLTAPLLNLFYIFK